MKDFEILENYLDKYPHLDKYMKAQLQDMLEWSPDMLANKLSGRTRITINEKRSINTLFNDKVFQVDPIQPIQLPQPSSV